MTGSVGANSPSRMCRSVPHNPQAATRTTTSRGPGTGSSTVATSTTPTDRMTAALTSPALRRCARSLHRSHGQAAYELVLCYPAGDQHRQARERRAGAQVRPELALARLEADQVDGHGGSVDRRQVHRKEELVPGEDETDQRGRGHAGADDGQDHRPQLAKERRAVDAGR